MGFKDTVGEFRLLDIALITPDPAHPRQSGDDASLKGLVNSIAKKGLIHPLIVRPADGDGRYRLIVGERRRQAALLAGETQVPVVIRDCSADEALEVQVFENLGLGVRAALEPRDMANALQRIAERFASTADAAEQFGRSQNWLNQATAAANLSPKVSALLDSGKISSTTTAIQLEKLAQKNEASAETLIVQIEQLPEGEKLPREVVDEALVEAGVRRPKKEKKAAKAKPPVDTAAAAPGEAAPADLPASQASAALPPWEEAAAPAAVNAVSQPRRVDPGKVRQVAAMLGLDDEDEATILDRLIDEFLALKAEAQTPD